MKRLREHAKFILSGAVSVFHYPHLWGDHFRLFVVDVVQSKLEIYDSVGKKSAEAVEETTKFLVLFHKMYCGVNLVHAILTPPEECLQGNNYDCGVFVCLFSDRRRESSSPDLNVTEEDIAKKRAEILKVITSS